MFRTPRKALGTGLATVLALGALAPAAPALPTDLRSPDARDATQPAQTVADGPPTWPASPQHIPAARATADAPDFDWDSAIIGAGTVVGAFAIAATGVVGLRHRRIAGRA